MIRQGLFFTLSLIGFALPNLAFSEHSISAVQTKSNYQETVFYFAGNRVQMQANNNNGGAIEYNVNLENGLTGGADFQYIRWDVVNDAAGYSGFASAYRLSAHGQYQFFRNRPFQPYIGAAFGRKRVSIRSASSARLDGYAISAIAGFEYRPIKQIGFSLAYKRSYEFLDDVSNNEIKTHGNTLAVSIKVYFINTD